MKAEDTSLWEFTAPITDQSVIQCPDCKEFSPLADWTENEVCCEECGSHTAIVCPKCEEKHDHVFAKPFEVQP